jgi:hypothetical protein
MLDIARQASAMLDGSGVGMMLGYSPPWKPEYWATPTLSTHRVQLSPPGGLSTIWRSGPSYGGSLLPGHWMNAVPSLTGANSRGWAERELGAEMQAAA